MKIEKKPLLNVALLSLITCRVYVIYWITVTTKDINSYMENEYISPTLACILSIITCGLFDIYWFYKYGNIVFNDMYKKADIDSYGENAFVLVLFFLIPFGYIYSVVTLQSKLNIIYDKIDIINDANS
ncbi:DUF4234 domain-containing protein [Brachyspira pilosicoli]|uniref:DUF4234 domain-containing protein n=3 Tax=Brachyspira pilosicoli TaxID=52584 RepID=D8IEC0_BRAP9|nr:DUF4234 domain-containing protein [Brachyspira pilosicoli]ADK31493.1 conserved hypothetical protein [Brachyspira pilosicoli 95/1000]CCG55755.1 hypothetical protein WESB_0283 [Brachyspira pilosicoli WesB]